tara:strand:- start:2788 stop:3336 length:549 start_codon:yes stop_codon:yes gene_type:complete
MNVNLGLQNLATHHGFQINPNHGWNGTVMSGMVGGYRCTIWFETVRRRSRRNRSKIYMHSTITLNVQKQLGLLITPQGFLTEGFRLPDSITGDQDIIIGNQMFDSIYRIKGFDENAIRTFLNPHRVQAILHIQQSLGPLQHLTINDQQISVRFPGLISDMRVVSNATTSIAWLAEQLDSNHQ